MSSYKTKRERDDEWRQIELESKALTDIAYGLLRKPPRRMTQKWIKQVRAAAIDVGNYTKLGLCSLDYASAIERRLRREVLKSIADGRCPNPAACAKRAMGE